MIEIILVQGFCPGWKIKLLNFLSLVTMRHIVPPRGGGTGVNFCWVCAAGLLEPLPNYSLFCGQLQAPSWSLLGKYVIFAIPT